MLERITLLENNMQDKLILIKSIKQLHNIFNFITYDLFGIYDFMFLINHYEQVKDVNVKSFT